MRIIINYCLYALAYLFRIMIYSNNIQMPCSICQTDRLQWCAIPCGHQVCSYCLQQYAAEERFRCQICLQIFFLQQLKNTKKSVKSQKNVSRNILFCLQCLQSFPVANIRGVKHAKHRFEPIQKCLDFIKEASAEKLNKLLMIGNQILMLTQPQQQQSQNDKFASLISQIQTNFDAIRQTLDHKEKQLIKEVQQLQQHHNKLLQIQMQSYHQIYRQVLDISEHLQRFLDDQVELAQDCFFIFQKDQESSFVRKLKQIERQQITIPTFICIDTIDNYLNSNLFLEYHKKYIKPSKQTPTNETSKRVNLMCRINRKMNLL